MMRTIATGVFLLGFTACAAAVDGGLTCPALAKPHPSVLDASNTVQVVEGENGWLFANVDFPPVVSYDTAPLQHLAEVLKRHGTTLVMIDVPSRALIYPEYISADVEAAFGPTSDRAQDYEATLSAIHAAGVLAPDLLVPLQTAAAQEQLFYKHDHHWTTAGAQHVAMEIASYLKSADGFQAGTEEFVTEDQGTVLKQGRYGKIASDLCGDVFGSEAIKVAKTTKADAADVGLLDDPQPAVIALAGTSFSNKDSADLFNFAGSLSSLTGFEVLNVAIDGGGLYSSIQQYIGSDDFKANPPRYLLWETALAQPLPSEDWSRQLVGVLEGQCVGEEVTKFVVDAGTRSKKSLEGMSTAGGEEYSLRLAYDDLAVSASDLQLQYADGTLEDLHLRRSELAVRDGLFYYELPSNQHGGISAISFDPQKNSYQGSINVSVCAQRPAGTQPTVANSTPDVFPRPRPARLGGASAGLHIEVQFQGESYAGDPVFRITADGNEIGTGAVTGGKGAEPETFDFTLPSGDNPETLRVYFTNDLYSDETNDRNLTLVSLQVDGKTIDLSAATVDKPVSVARPSSTTVVFYGSTFVTVPRPETGW